MPLFLLIPPPSNVVEAGASERATHTHKHAAAAAVVAVVVLSTRCGALTRSTFLSFAALALSIVAAGMGEETAIGNGAGEMGK
jgi:hypothetical protein